MSYLSKEQVKLLKLIRCKNELSEAEISKNLSDTSDYLCQIGFAEWDTKLVDCKNSVFGIFTKRTKINITEQGKSYLDALHTEKFRFAVPLIISTALSVIALFISIIALIKP